MNSVQELLLRTKQRKLKKDLVYIKNRKENLEREVDQAKNRSAEIEIEKERIRASRESEKENASMLVLQLSEEINDATQDINDAIEILRKQKVNQKASQENLKSIIEQKNLAIKNQEIVQNQIRIAENSISELKLKKKKYDENLSRAISGINSAKNLIAKSEKESKRLQSENNELEEKKRKNESDIPLQTNEKEKQLAQLKTHEDQFAVLNKSIKNGNSDIINETNKYQELITTSQNLSNQKIDLSNQLKILENDVRKSADVLQNKTQEVVSLENKLNSSQKEFNLTKQKLDNVLIQQKEVGSEVEKLKIKRKTLENSHEDIETRYKEKDDIYQNTLENIDNRRKELADMQVRKDELTTKLQDLVAEVKNANKHLEEVIVNDAPTPIVVPNEARPVSQSPARKLSSKRPEGF